MLIVSNPPVPQVSASTPESKPERKHARIKTRVQACRNQNHTAATNIPKPPKSPLCMTRIPSLDLPVFCCRLTSHPRIQALITNRTHPSQSPPPTSPTAHPYPPRSASASTPRHPRRGTGHTSPT